MLLSAANSGCGLAAQAIAGFKETTVSSELRRRTVVVDTQPSGGRVVQVDPAGLERHLGPGPVEAHYQQTVEVQRVEPRYGWMLLGVGVEVAAWLVASSVCAATDCAWQPGLGIAAVPVLADLALTAFAVSRSSSVEERPPTSPAVSFYGVSPDRRSEVVAVLGAPIRLDLGLTQPRLAPTPRGPGWALVVEQDLGSGANAALVVSAVEDAARAELRGRGEEASEISDGSRRLRLRIEADERECRLTLIGADAERVVEARGPCEPDPLADLAHALVGAFLQHEADTSP